MSQIFVYMTAGSKAEAVKIAEDLVKRRLAACANVLPGITSIYTWQEELQKEKETAVIFKSTRSKFEELRQAIVEQHSYDCPCVISIPIQDGHMPFLKWIADQTL